MVEEERFQWKVEKDTVELGVSSDGAAGPVTASVSRPTPQIIHELAPSFTAELFWPCPAIC
jgi:hypothetical protein